MIMEAASDGGLHFIQIPLARFTGLLATDRARAKLVGQHGVVRSARSTEFAVLDRNDAKGQSAHGKTEDDCSEDNNE